METSTPQPLPPEIYVEQLSPDELRYVLPRRPLGKYRWFGLVPIGFALIASTFLWGWFAAVADWPAQMPEPISMLFVAIGLVSAVPMVLLPIAFSVAMLWGHSTVEVRGGRLLLGEHVGPLRWRRRLPLAQIKRLVVDSPGKTETQTRRSSSPLSKLAAIRMEALRGKPRWGAIGYPREWLVPLAHELARLVRAAQPDLSKPAAATEPQVDVVNVVEVVDDRGPVQRFIQPAGSLIVMTDQPGSLTFKVPPAGIKGGTAGLFGFACIWLAFMTVFTTVAVIALVQGNQPQQAQPNELPSWTIIPFILFFWLIGIGMMLAAVHMARRRAAIAVADGRCLVIQAGLFGEKKQVWEASELTTVQVGPSGMEVNDKPVMELQFIPRAGKKFGVLSARDVAELEWLATRLTQALGLSPARAGAAVLADVDTKPPNSDVVCEELPGALTISIPRSRLRRGPLFFWFFAAFWNGLNAVVATPFVLAARKDAIGESLFPLAMMSLFGLIGVAMIGWAIHITIRHAEIAFAAGRLLVLQFGLFGKRRHEWAIEELAAVRAAASDTSVNNRPLVQLQIVPTSGKTVSLLTGRDDQELAWIATMLRRTLELPAETDTERGV